MGEFLEAELALKRSLPRMGPHMLDHITFAIEASKAKLAFVFILVVVLFFFGRCGPVDIKNTLHEETHNQTSGI